MIMLSLHPFFGLHVFLLTSGNLSLITLTSLFPSLFDLRVHSRFLHNIHTFIPSTPQSPLMLSILSSYSSLYIHSSSFILQRYKFWLCLQLLNICPFMLCSSDVLQFLSLPLLSSQNMLLRHCCLRSLISSV